MLLFSCLISGVSAAPATPAPLMTVPANDTPLSKVAGGPAVPLADLRPQDTITLLDLESDQKTFPGPRSMAFGPRFIRLTTDLPTLLITVAGSCLVVLAVVLDRRKKAADTCASIQEPENGREK